MIDPVEVFRALGDPIRLRMLQMLLENPEVACTSYENEFRISKSTISYHIKTLKAAGLITVRKNGRNYIYKMRRPDVEHDMPGLLNILPALPAQAHQPYAEEAPALSLPDLGSRNEDAEIAPAAPVPAELPSSR